MDRFRAFRFNAFRTYRVLQYQCFLIDSYTVGCPVSGNKHDNENSQDQNDCHRHAEPKLAGCQPVSFPQVFRNVPDPFLSSERGFRGCATHCVHTYTFLVFRFVVCRHA